MFGLSKRARAKKALSSAIRYLLIGRRDDREELLTEMATEVEAVTREVTGEADAYAAAVRLVKDFVVNKLESLSVDERVDLLEGVVAKRLTAQPEIMRLIAHVAYCIAVLEDDDKAPISKGTTDEFLTIIAAWFSDDEKLQLRVLRFLYQSTENHHAYLQQVKRENEERLGYRPKGNAAG